MKSALFPFAAKPQILALAIATLLLSPVASAAENGWYVGAAAGLTQQDIKMSNTFVAVLPAGFSVTSYSDDEHDKGGKIFGGYQFNKYFAVEGGYFDLGDFSYRAGTNPAGNVSAKYAVEGLNLDLIGMFPVTEKLSLLGSVGYNNAKTTTDFRSSGLAPAVIPRNREENEHIKYGVGVQYALNDAVSLRLEAERFRLDRPAGNPGNVDLYSLGVIYHFGQKKPVQQEAARAPASVAPTPAPRAAAPTPTPVAAPTPTRVVFSADSLFDFDKSDIKPAGKAELDKLISDLSGVTYDVIAVTGHSDRLGKESYNMALSVRRADAVKAYLVQAGRISASKITARGVDGSNPVTTPTECNNLPTRAALIGCLQPDRRVEVEVTGTK